MSSNEDNTSQPPLAPPLPDSLPKPPAPTPPSTTQSSTSELSAKRAKMAAQYGAAGPWKPKPHLFSSTTFTPCHMFFYGTLMDAKFIQVVTRSPDVPVLKKGYITGFRPKKWATYPTLIPLAELPEEQVAAEERKLQVHGVFWKCEDYDHFKELQRYETSKYRGERVQIHTNDPDDESNDVIVDDGVVFVWAMNPQSPDLEEGEFDIAQYQKDLKPSFFG